MKYGQKVTYKGFKCIFFGICKGKNDRYINLHMDDMLQTNGFNVPEEKWNEIKERK